MRNSSRHSVIVFLPVVTVFLRSVNALTGVVTVLSGAVTVFFPLVNVRAGGKIDPDSGFRHFASTFSTPPRRMTTPEWPDSAKHGDDAVSATPRPNHADAMDDPSKTESADAGHQTIITSTAQPPAPIHMPPARRA